MHGETHSSQKEGAMNPEQNLRKMLLAVRDAYAGDADLVRPGAAKHGVQVTEGNLVEPLSPGNYNARIPDGSQAEIDAIKKAETIAFICEDYRQSGYLANDNLHASVIFASAGGVVQPDETRQDLEADLALAIHKVNHKARIIFAFHTKRCGGGAHFTEHMGEKSMDSIIEREGDEGEMKAMTDYALQLIKKLVNRGMPPDRIELRAVILKPEHGHGEYHSVESVKTLSLPF